MVPSALNLRRTFGLALLVGGLLFGLTLSGGGPTTALAQEGESTNPTQASITLLTAILDDVAAEADEGEFSEALELVDRFEGVLNEVRGFLIASAGEVAEVELAEIDSFLPRLRDALEAGDADQATTVINTIQGELAEIGSAAVGPADSATAALDRIDELLATIIEEIEEGEFDEAFQFTERLEGLIEANRELLIEAGGELAETELAEVDQFIGRLESALEAENAEDALNAAEVIRGEFAEIREALVGEADSATAALDRIDELLGTIAEEIEEGEFSEAFQFTERLEGLIEANRQLLIDAAGDVAEEELAEIDEFIGRLEGAIEDEDADLANRTISLIREEFAEIREALGDAGDEASTATVGVGSVEVAAGETATVALDVSGLSAPLGAYNVSISFDPSVVQLTDVSVTYGTPLPAPQIDNEAGSVRIQGIKPEDAQSGEFPIAELTFEAVGSSGQSTSLAPSVDELTDSDGQSIEATVEAGEVTVQ